MLSEQIAAQLQRDGPAPLAEQVYGAMRTLVLAAVLKPGQRLPPSRQLAQDLDVSRNTILAAYARLADEGYLAGRVGAGSYVAETLPEARLHAKPGTVARELAGPVGGTLSQRAHAVLGEAVIADGAAFAPCVPDLSHFPFQVWQRLLSRAWRDVRMADVRYASPGGLPALRAAIASHVQLARQVRCTPEQVVVVNGAQHGLDLCARLLADHGERAWVEDPGYPGARRMFRAAGLELAPIPVDDEGLAPQERHWRKPPRLVYITPSHQFPTGAVMSLQRRRALLEAAAACGAWIIEDDYDGEFRFEGRPIASLQGIDRGGRVVYLGTFSKAMFPGLRLGYLVLPESVAARFTEAASRLSFEGRQVTHAALAAFMQEGHFAAYIRRMRLLYAQRRALFAHVWQEELRELAPLAGTDAGMHVIARLPDGMDETVSRLAQQHGIAAQALSGFYLGRPDRYGLVLGYGAVDEEAIRREGKALARLVKGALA
ncbi:PLP-dependent aminotransferase family protein [Pseudoduganella ginsengisoli]|uniref:Aminotransferase class I/II-fold pyridoxal phosphate-dependent enzyme n=1 Tax=Pseudoduganella ginsengisoli TaxID=1462440 RepID=A0A6L6PW52_9BURK|nr:PLP-dependent aminotransferase family protein [Pseudoduganella ginsengisoli]MTW01374.1 aminotransferase class I/II-fold pyridoxal phosphate-dependent enzyme [Pseudoduganella ginsengisoli]